MADPSITIRVNPEIKGEIVKLVDSDKYRSITEFIDRAIKEKLERERIDSMSQFKQTLITLLKNDPEIHEILVKFNGQISRNNKPSK